MTKVGFVGCGEMGEPMAGHVLKRGKFEVWVFDIRKAATKAIARRGAKVAGSLEELGRHCDLIVVMVGYDHQVKQVVTDLPPIQVELIIAQPANVGAGLPDLAL